jgi:hypothetical protein
MAGERYADVTEYPQLADFADMARMAKADMPIPGDALERMAKWRSQNLDELKKSLGVKQYQPPDKSSYSRWSVADQLKYSLLGISPPHVREAFWAHGANGEIVQEEGDKVFKYTRRGGAVSCERYGQNVSE